MGLGVAGLHVGLGARGKVSHFLLRSHMRCNFALVRLPVTCSVVCKHQNMLGGCHVIPVESDSVDQIEASVG